MSSSILPSALCQTHSSSSSGVNIKFTDNGDMMWNNHLHESEVISVALNLTIDMPVLQVQRALVNLGLCIRSGTCELPNKHFRAILKMLLYMLEASSTDVVMEALFVISKILCRVQMMSHWIKFVELIILKIIDCYAKGKDIISKLDMLIVPRIVPPLPLNLTINILEPVIATCSYPRNLGGLVLLTEFAGHHGFELTESHLDRVFPHLVCLTEHNEVRVRKAAVYCIVKLYIVMGDAMVRPKLGMLNFRRVKLVNIYVEKHRNALNGAKY